MSISNKDQSRLRQLEKVALKGKTSWLHAAGLFCKKNEIFGNNELRSSFQLKVGKVY